MQFLHQNLDELVESLSPLDSNWQDETSIEAIKILRAWPKKPSYGTADVEKLLDSDFTLGLLVCRLFLSLSKDEMETALATSLGSGGIGVTRYKLNKTEFLSTLEEMGLHEAMSQAVNVKPVWSDILVERLRSTRGKAIRGQSRGRGLEDFTETVVRSVFGDNYQPRCNFTGPNGETAKCDFAIPDRELPRILIEAKGYGATGSKMTDIIGDLNTIIANKRPDTTLILVTDGVTWRRRLGDLRKIVEMQNKGKIARIYTTNMVDAFERDMRVLKSTHGL